MADSSADATAATPAASSRRNGLRFDRFFTTPGSRAYDLIEWERRTAAITNAQGRVFFEQKDVEVPRAWSQLASNIVAQKYFWGRPGTSERESSVRQLVDRVVEALVGWGRAGGYFATEQDAENWAQDLRWLLVTQHASFNSPVWFNIGIRGRSQQASACFINSVEDTMESILDLAKTEGMLFKFGSGTGTNLSVLRSSQESLAGGGTASGPVSFMRGYDSFAGSIKSGGTTRRAAKMVILNADHPDILDFVRCKAEEEKKAWALIAAGYDAGFNVPGGAYDSVQFQNANHSVRVTDDFMQALEKDGDWTTHAVTDRRPMGTMKAADLWKEIAGAAWVCGDPGVQFDTTIQNWNTVPNTGRINATNPCAEFIFVDDSSCNLLSLNLRKFQNQEATIDVERMKRAIDICFTAQEILVSNASYPTPGIAENSERLRPLGLGYANLGALLMSMGHAYDSPDGRAVAGAVTALMTGEAYAQSARMAAVQGPFSEFPKNRDPMLGVMRRHQEAAEKLPATGDTAHLAGAARKAWAEAIALGERHGYRNAQATVVAPTGCLVGDSLVLTDRGLRRLHSLGDPNGRKWQDVDFRVATDDGPRRATKFYVNGAEPVVTVTTRRGYRIRGTASHRVKVVDAGGEWQWRRLADIKGGDRVPLMLGGVLGNPRPVVVPPLDEPHWNSESISCPREVTPGLAELVGYFMGDGSLHARGLRLCVWEGDRDVVQRLQELSRTLFDLEPSITEKQGYVEVGLHSVRLALWWDACGFAKHPRPDGRKGKGHLPHVPEALLATNDPVVYGAFLRGLFEADGTVTAGFVSFSTVAPDFARDVQTVMLALGMVTTLREERPGNSWGQAPRYQVRLLNQATNEAFLRHVGFMSARKRGHCREGDHGQAARFDRIPVPLELVNRLTPNNDRLRKVLLMELRRDGVVSRRAATQLLDRTECGELRELLRFFYDSVVSTELGEEAWTLDLSVPDNVTYVANGFVSHNTIGLMMDCDTTGIEPDLALVKYKTLVGGGSLKMVNATVPTALSRLGYTEDDIRAIVAYIDANDTIEGAPGLRAEDLPVFDCAFRPLNGKRSIAPMGHVRMMAAVQPFVSGSQSKTVNLPNDATAEDIASVYRQSWSLGLKCIAIYRDGCKRSQPLSTSEKKSTGEKPPAQPQTVAAGQTVPAPVAPEPRPYRRRLPDERTAITHKFEIQGHEGYITVGMYPDGKPGEVFIKMAKEGSTISGLMDALATQTSVALQYGVPLEVMVNKFSHMRFEPAGMTRNRQIPIAKSIVDYIFRWLASRFLDEEAQDAVGVIRRDDDPPRTSAGSSPLIASATPSPAGTNGHVEDHPDPGASVGPARLTFATNADAPACAECGSITVRSGACYKCLNCGATTGCG